jgi:hypothetical protein
LWCNPKIQYYQYQSPPLTSSSTSWIHFTLLYTVMLLCIMDSGVPSDHLSWIYEESCLLRYNSLYSAESKQTFQRNLPHLCLGLKNKPNKIQNDSSTCCLLLFWFLLGLFFYSEDGGEMFIRKVTWLSADYRAIYPRKFIISHMTSGQSSWLQIQRSRFNSWHYHIFWEVVGENGVHSASWLQLRSYLEETVVVPVESQECGCGDPLNWPRDTLQWIILGWIL